MATAATNNLIGRRLAWRSLLASLLLPLAIAASHQFVLRWFFERGGREDWQVAACFAVFVLQVGVAGSIAMRFVRGILSWVVFGWTLLVIDLMTFCMAVTQSGGMIESGKMLGSAFVAGQVGAAIVWGVLGDQRWAIRIPLTATVAVTLLLSWRFVLNNLFSYITDWFPLLLLQSVLIFAISMVFRQRSRRLMHYAAVDAQHRRLDGKNVWQFNLKDAFIQITAIAVVMGIFRMTAALQSYHFRQFSLLGFVAEVVLAALLAIVMTTALWAAFGDRHWLIRIFVASGISLIFGASIGWSCNYFEDWTLLDYPNRRSLRDTMWFTRLTWWWLPWICLASGFLVATLWAFRETGYRLVRVERKRIAGT